MEKNNTNTKTNNKLYNNKYFKQYYSKNNSINCHLNNEYFNNKKDLNLYGEYFISKSLLAYIINLKNILCIIIIKLLNGISLFNKNLYKRTLFFSFTLFLFISNIKILNAYQEINITINGTGRQQIVDKDYFDNKPNEILINGILQNYSDYYVYNLAQNINIITMRWDNKLTSCYNMFYNLNNIIDFNFSNFDTSEVKNMCCMFEKVKSLKSLDLSSFNTSSVENMEFMFNGCTSLVSLNLNNFDTSKVTNMGLMFSKLSSIKQF